MSKNTSDNDARKTCYCITCARYFHPLGIMGHRAGHLNRGEECTIEFTNGNAGTYRPRSDAPVEIVSDGNSYDNTAASVIREAFLNELY